MNRVILLADDSITIQKVIELTFMDQDYQVVAVSNGDEAKSKLEGISPDIVLCDVHMPGASGYDVCRFSKQRHPQVPVLLLVGTFEPFDESESKAAGADAFLKKPFDSQELLQRVEELLGATASPEPDATDDGDEAAEAEAAAEVSGGEAPAADEGEDDDLDAWDQLEIAGEGAGTVWPDLDSSRAAPEPEAVSAGTGAAADGGDPFVDAHQEEAPAEPGEEPTAKEGFVLPEPFAVEEEGDEATSAPAADEDAAADWKDQTWPGAAEASSEESDEPGSEVALEAPLVPPWESSEADEDAVPSPEKEVAAGEQATAPPAGTAGEAAGAAAATDATRAVAGLSDQDVERIARRVAEMIGEQVVRDVAWEVIPDLAEIIIKERLEALESRLES